jgi:ABC-type antimicrobial peptide transport system permease subunit
LEDTPLTYGKNKQTTSSSLSFWVIPYRLIAIIIVALIAGFFGLRYAIRRYNRYILGGASGKKRRRRK